MKRVAGLLALSLAVGNPCGAQQANARERLVIGGSPLSSQRVEVFLGMERDLLLGRLQASHLEAKEFESERGTLRIVIAADPTISDPVDRVLAQTELGKVTFNERGVIVRAERVVWDYLDYSRLTPDPADVVSGLFVAVHEAVRTFVAENRTACGLSEATNVAPALVTRRVLLRCGSKAIQMQTVQIAASSAGPKVGPNPRILEVLEESGPR